MCHIPKCTCFDYGEGDCGEMIIRCISCVYVYDIIYLFYPSIYLFICEGPSTKDFGLS